MCLFISDGTPFSAVTLSLEALAVTIQYSVAPSFSCVKTKTFLRSNAFYNTFIVPSITSFLPNCLLNNHSFYLNKSQL